MGEVPADLDNQVIAIIAESQGKDPKVVERQTTLRELDVNSIDVVDIAIKLSTILGVDIPCRDFGELWGGEVPVSGLNPSSYEKVSASSERDPTVEDLLNFVRARVASTPEAVSA